jgi:predicted amidohydrolase
MQDLARQTGMVVVAPMYEEDDKASGIYYNTAAVIDADGTYLGKYRKTHIPHVKGFWEKFYFRPGNLGYPVFETAVVKVGVYICYDRHFPEGARALGLNGAEIVLIPSATSRGLSEYLWRVEQVSHALANGYYVGTINRVGVEPLGDDDFYGQSYFVDPRGHLVAQLAAVGVPCREATSCTGVHQLQPSAVLRARPGDAAAAEVVGVAGERRLLGTADRAGDEIHRSAGSLPGRPGARHHLLEGEPHLPVQVTCGDFRLVRPGHGVLVRRRGRRAYSHYRRNAPQDRAG